MGYRNETEHLRERVQQLEGTLAALRGERRSGRAETFARRASRQTLFIAIPAIGASLFMCLFLAVAVGVTIQTSNASYTDVFGANGYESVGFPATPNYEGLIRADPGDYNRRPLVPTIEDPRILLSCSYGCPRSVRVAFQNAEMGLEPASTEQFYRGMVEAYDPNLGYGYPEDGIAAHALAHSIDLRQIRIVEVSGGGDGVGPVWGMFVFFLLGTLCLWGAVLLHRRLVKRDVAFATERDLIFREPGTTLILTILTCRIYELIWLYQTTGQIRRITGRPDLLPALDVFLTFATCGLWSYWVMYRNAEAVDELLSDRGTPTAHRSTVVGLSIGSFICGVLHWVLVFKMQELYNIAAADEGNAAPDVH